MRKQIEGNLPLRMVNRSAMNEKAGKEHPGNMHLWWNRSPIESSRVLIKAMLLDEESDDSHNKTKKAITIVDPFSGFGGLSLAVEKSGLPVIAGDLNSVAVVLTKAAAEIPARFTDNKPVSPYAENRIYSGSQGLAEDIRCYGNVILKKLAAKILKAYPDAICKDVNGKRVYAWIWTRTAPCPNPACNCRMPLSSSYTLSKQKGREYYIKPEVINGEITFHVVKGISAEAHQGNKIGKSGAKFRCPSCGVITTDEYVKSVGKEGKLGIQLMSVGYEGPDGREYVSPTLEHITAASLERPADIPLGAIPNNTRWFSPPLFGLKEYSDLYSPRQLLLLTSLCDMICELKEEIAEDAKRAGMPDDGIRLTDGGSGACAYSEAVSVYLSFVADKLANFQSEICTWDNRMGNIRAAFTRQAIPMTWVFAEGNPFSSVTGNYDRMLNDVVQSVKNLKCEKLVKVVQGDGTKFRFPENSILFTELPYYDNVGYADLSDYFYVWMRRCLKDVYHELFEKVVTSKEELSSIPEHYGGDANVAKKEYEEGIRRLCKCFSQSASTEYPSLIFFEFAKIDEEAMVKEDPDPYENSSWENILDALLQSGFQVSAVLPVRTEMPNDHYNSVRVAIVFRKKEDDAPQVTRRGFVGELKRELPQLLETRFQAEIDDWDRPITGMGCGLSLFSRYRRIINADGTNMSVHDALKVIWAEVIAYIEGTFSDDNRMESKEVSHAREL